MFFILVIIIFITLPSTLIYYVESNWTYLDCVYYTFVSLTTIGFGDLATAQGEQERLGKWMFAYNGFTLVWLIFGLGFISMNNTLLADRIKKISNRLGNFSIIPLLMSIPTHTQVETKKYDEHEMNILTHTTRRVSDPSISFSARSSDFKLNLHMARPIARGRSLKIPAVITFDVSKDNESLQIINNMPNTELVDLRKKYTELQRANEGLQVANNAAEAELITLREKCTLLRKANSAAKVELIALRKKCQLVTEANEGLLIANYAAEDELVNQRKKSHRIMKNCISKSLLQ